MKYVIPDLNNIHQFREIRRMFTRIRERSVKKKKELTVKKRKQKSLNIFLILLESVKKEKVLSFTFYSINNKKKNLIYTIH